MASVATPRCLSVQSSVIYGYVGNKCSVLALQLHGFDVDPIHSCQLSNHTQYPVFKGERSDGKPMLEALEAMELNGFIPKYTHMLAGYLTSEAFARSFVHLVQRFRLAAPARRLFFLCDPVMGDCGRLYVPESIVPIYRDHLLPLSDLITPNQTEAEYAE